MRDAQQTFDAQVRSHIYDVFVRNSMPPSVPDTATALMTTDERVSASYRRLHQAHALVLERGSLDVRLAFPFSAVPTSFPVRVGQRSYFSSCAWDALGIGAALHQDAEIDTCCADCGETLAISVTHGSLQRGEHVVHFAVPASAWWEDVVYT